MDFVAFRDGVRSRALALGANENEMEQLGIYLEAFHVFTQRELKYNSLWKQYGAVDSYHHVTSKAARTQFYLEGHEDESDPLDLINYTVFLIRNMRAGRIHNQVDPKARFHELFKTLLELSHEQLKDVVDALDPRQRDALRRFLGA